MKIYSYFLLVIGALCLTGAVFLAAGYARFLSPIEGTLALVLLTGFFGFLGGYLKERGW